MKKILSLFLVVLMCATMVLPIYAADGMVTPRYNNTAMATASFFITSTGLAVATLDYTGYPDYATGANITCKIEKKFLWWWNDVDGAEWTTNLSGSSNSIEYTYQLSKTGTYRMSFEITVYGTAGDPDVISDTIEKEY